MSYVIRMSLRSRALIHLTPFVVQNVCHDLGLTDIKHGAKRP